MLFLTSSAAGAMFIARAGAAGRGTDEAAALAVALPAFVWALRRGQFRGKEQIEWHLDDTEALVAPPNLSPLNVRRTHWMLGILSTLAVLMLGSVFLVMFMALQATAHPATGKCPF